MEKLKKQEEENGEWISFDNFLLKYVIYSVWYDLSLGINEEKTIRNYCRRKKKLEFSLKKQERRNRMIESE